MKRQTPGTDLQNFTETPPAVLKLLQQEAITQEQISALTREQADLLCQILSRQLSEATTGEEKERLYRQFEQFATEQTKSDYWESNHKAITAALSNYLNEYNSLPSKSRLAELTGLSRQTVHKHFKEYKQAPFFKFQAEQLELLANNLLARMYAFACQGNVQAAKLYFEMIGALKPIKAAPAQQVTNNNFVQINNTILSQENLKQLSPSQLEAIETLLQSALGK